MRCLPPVHSPITPAGILRGAAAAAALTNAAAERLELERTLTNTYSSEGILLCDSGTSALAGAFSILAARGKARIACPAYVCVDVGAAAVAGDVELALYDTDPATLSPDISSLERVMRNGCEAVLVAHLYGYPVAIDEILALCRRSGVLLIEDAAQEAGATSGGRRLGSFGNLSVVSFGRGKGVTGGGGGALMKSADSALALPALDVRDLERGGWRQLTMTFAQWFLGRPSLYGLPLAIPGLHLGEMVYHEAHLPRHISRASVAMVRASIAAQPEAVAARRTNAARIRNAVEDAAGVSAIAQLPGSEPSFLRFPVVDKGAGLLPSSRIGAVRGYPRLLDEESRLGTRARRGSEKLPGAGELRDRLFTVPTHQMLRERDHVAIRNWLTSSR